MTKHNFFLQQNFLSKFPPPQLTERKKETKKTKKTKKPKKPKKKT